MATKHIVKCLYCEKSFDANIEPYEKVGRRYAHIDCYKNYQANKSKEEKDKEALEKYILELFGLEYITPRIKKQINSYLNEYKYTYSGMLRSLKYFFEIKRNDVEKANQGIGIIPYIYQDAYNYYYNLWLIKEKNKNKFKEKFTNYKPEEIEIKIAEPKRKVRRRKLFSFLDSEEKEDGQ